MEGEGDAVADGLRVSETEPVGLGDWESVCDAVGSSVSELVEVGLDDDVRLSETVSEGDCVDEELLVGETLVECVAELVGSEDSEDECDIDNE